MTNTEALELVQKCLDDWPYAATRVVDIMTRLEKVKELLKEQEEETSRLTKMCKVLLNRCKAIVNADGATCAYCTLKEECDKIYMD